MKLKNMGYLLARTSRAHHNLASRTFPQLGLHRGQVPVLLELTETDGITQSELVERLEVTPATLTNLLNRMEESGFILRQRDPADTRVSRVYLSEKGLSTAEQFSQLAETVDGITFAGFSPEELETLTGFLERVHANLVSQV